MGKLDRIGAGPSLTKAVAPFNNEDGDSEGPRDREAVRIRYTSETTMTKKWDLYKLRVMLWAASYGKLDILERLIRQGFSPFTRIKKLNKRSPFLNAVSKNQIPAVKYILDRFEYSDGKRTSAKFVKKFLKKGDY